jgi:hypothetical protein
MTVPLRLKTLTDGARGTAMVVLPVWPLSKTAQNLPSKNFRQSLGKSGTA